MQRVVWLALGTAVVSANGCASRTIPTRDPQQRGAYVVDAGGRPIRALESGSTLHVGARGLRPSRLYEFRFAIDRQDIATRENAIGFARVMTDQTGTVAPFVLWYESGVVGCSARERERPNRAAFRFRDFEEAEQALRGRRITVSARPVDIDRTGRTPPMELPVGNEETAFDIPVAIRRSPMVFPSREDACLLNSQEVGTGDMYVSGRNFTPGEVLEVSVVPNQRAWHVGDVVNDVTGASFAAAPERATVNAVGRFTIRAWGRVNQHQGAYDIVVRRASIDTVGIRRVRVEDIVSFASETAFLLFLRYPVGGPTMDIAGRQLSGSPYFEFADSFAETDDPVWGAVDPTYVPPAHPGGTWAAYYVVNHRDVNGWDPAAGGSTALTDVSGGIEIHPVKSGCVNGTDVIIWQQPLTLGNYDVVVDFGSTTATSAATYSTDGQYDATVDFLDGADQIGFTVARDPYELGPIAIGTDSYSLDNAFPTLGGASNVDLRAVVRYPATTGGPGMPVAAGTHPLFIIEHGNHGLCRVATDGRPYYDVIKEYYDGVITYAQLTALSYDHVGCPDRARNHEGYMRLLDILASHGVIAVSIDAYDLTGPVPQWIWERGTLILKHIELWSHMNNTATYTTYTDFFAGRFAGHLDLSRISVSGHSRGGEASVAAYMLNTAFTIGSVSSIGPVDGQSYVLPDVPYFVILPAADCDVATLSGARIYDRAGSTLPGPDATTKSGINVYGANHNAFNTVWAQDWDDCYPLTRPDHVDAADQQKLGESYLAAFTRVHLLGEIVYEDMLRGRLTFPSTAGPKIYAMRHEKSHRKLVDGSTTAPLTLAGGVTATVVTNPSPHRTQALRVAWPSSGATITYTVPVGQRDATTFEVLSFRAAQTFSASNPASGSQNFQIEMVGGGMTKAVYVGKFDPIPKAYSHPEGVVHTTMTVVRIPLHSFIMNNAGVTLNDIDTIRLKFLSPATGEIYVDDIEFSR